MGKLLKLKTCRIKPDPERNNLKLIATESIILDSDQIADIYKGRFYTFVVRLTDDTFIRIQPESTPELCKVVKRELWDLPDEEGI